MVKIVSTSIIISITITVFVLHVYLFRSRVGLEKMRLQILRKGQITRELFSRYAMTAFPAESG